MSTQVSDVPTSAPKINRPIAEFPANIWGTTFFKRVTKFQTIDSETQKQHQELIEEVRRMITDETCTTSRKLELIHDVQILGVSYHYEKEIKVELENIHNATYDNDITDLHIVSLRFRLLRQQGIKSSSGVFQKFKDGEGKYKRSLIKDIRGMLSLNQAAHLRIHGEPILDEALVFTKTHLKEMIPHVSIELAEEITHELNHPLYTVLPRLVAVHFLSIYHRRESHNKSLLKLAKLDFNIIQGMLQKELSDIMQWWIDLDLPTNLTYARDRIVECFFWIAGVYFQPEYDFARNALTRVIKMCSILDDTFDAYGTMEELTAFNSAVQKWDINVINTLPDYMKIIYKALLDLYDDIGEDLAKQGNAYCKHYVITAIQKQVNVYHIEALWCHKRYVPTYEEYIDVALVSGGYPMLAITSFIGMGDIVSKEVMEWVSNSPRMVRASAIMARLMDDKTSNQFEQKRGHVVSAIECYMNQYGVSNEEVLKMCDREIDIAWKDINEDILNLHVNISMPFLQRILNLTRVLDVMYFSGGDAYTHNHLMKGYVISLLRDSILL